MSHVQPRYLAPAALAVFLLGLALVVSMSLGGGGSDGTAASAESPESTATSTATKTPKGDKPRKKGRRTYTVKAGDTPSGIAEKTGVPLTTLEELNPDLDPQQLAPGQKIRLRR